jgi:glycosyltransferase involved in cell wall biosynthesis
MTRQDPSDRGDLRPFQLRPGVSVIIPSFGGRDRIETCLRSLAAQTLAPENFEVIVVLNGPPDGTRRQLDRFRSEHPELNLRTLELSEPGSSQARNAGIAAATRQHSTFIDDDDSVSPGYLKTLLVHARPQVVPFAQIVNVETEGRINPETTINVQTLPFTGRLVHPVLVPRAVGFNACKLVPTEVIKRIRYDTELQSGDDVAFFMALLARYDFRIFVCPVDSRPAAENAVYYRLLRPDSISRQETSFEFNVIARMKVISRLDEFLRAGLDEPRREVLRLSIRGQASFINSYLADHPDQAERVLRTIDSYQISEFPYHRLTRGLARSLVVSGFPPGAATSGVAMAKRIRSRGEIVDLVCPAMDSARHLDLSTTRITQGLIDGDLRIDPPTRFWDWSGVERFCEQGLARVGHRAYRRLYSQGASPAGHLLAAAYKARNPATWWSAEPANPISLATDRSQRKMRLKPCRLVDLLSGCLSERGLPVPDTDDALRWREHLAFALADQVVFTNPTQMEYLLGSCDHPELVRAVRKKAVIQPLPTLPRRLYHAVEAEYAVPDGFVSLGHFGGDLTGGIDDLLVAVSTLEPEVRRWVRLHFFTSRPNRLTARAGRLHVSGNVLARACVPYLDFLNLTTKFDWLVVSEARTADPHVGKPHLPPEWSDYRGSGRPVWGLVEPGSPLSREPLDHASPLGDVAAARAWLAEIVATRRRTASVERVPSPRPAAYPP